MYLDNILSSNDDNKSMEIFLFFFCRKKWFIKSYYVLSHCWRCAAESLWRWERRLPMPLLCRLAERIVGCLLCLLGAARVKVEKRGGKAAVSSPLPGGCFGIKLCLGWKKWNPDILAFAVNIWLSVRVAKSTEVLCFLPCLASRKINSSMELLQKLFRLGTCCKNVFCVSLLASVSRLWFLSCSWSQCASEVQANLLHY